MIEISNDTKRFEDARNVHGAVEPALFSAADREIMAAVSSDQLRTDVIIALWHRVYLQIQNAVDRSVEREFLDSIRKPRPPRNDRS